MKLKLSDLDVFNETVQSLGNQFAKDEKVFSQLSCCSTQHNFKWHLAAVLF